MTMTYDARNRVVSRSVNGDTETFVYDGWKLIEDYDSNGTEDAWYVNGPGADEILTRNPTIGEISYYTQDGNGNVTTITDAGGDVQERYTYDVYGTPTIANAAGTTITTSAVGNRFLFTGREYISQIGLYDYRNRVYSPGLGRFLQTDPIRFNAGDVNICRYVGNGPVNWGDSFGLKVEMWYNQRTGHLDIYNDKNNKVTSLDGLHSGKGEDMDNPNSNDKNGKGPTPTGDYDVYDRHNSDGSDNFKNTGAPGYILDPQDSDPGNGKWDGENGNRGDLRIHKGGAGDSDGCLTADGDNWDKLNDILQKTTPDGTGTIRSSDGQVFRHEKHLGVLHVY